MVTSKRRLLMAVRLLDGIIEDFSTAPNGNQGSSRALLVQLNRLRELLFEELERPEPNWRAVVAPALREAVRWLVEWGIDNTQYKLSPLVGRACRLRRRGNWSRVEVLPA